MSQFSLTLLEKKPLGPLDLEEILLSFYKHMASQLAKFEMDFHCKSATRRLGDTMHSVRRYKNIDRRKFLGLGA